MDDKQLRAPIEFAEVFGASVERIGCPRMAGRIWGGLRVGVFPEHTAAQMAERGLGLLRRHLRSTAKGSKNIVTCASSLRKSPLRLLRNGKEREGRQSHEAPRRT